MQTQGRSDQLDLLAPLLSRPWAISQHNFAALQGMFRAVMDASVEGFFDLADFVTPRAEMQISDGGAATVHVQGALADKAPPIWEKLGQTDYRSIRGEIASASAAGATSLNLLIDSPGGALAGLEEASRDIQAFSAQGSVHAHCDGMACSAAYHLAASADTISATPSSDVGNIGVVMAFADTTKFYEAMGVEFHVLTNEGADLKSTFRTSPTDSQLEFLQNDIDAHGRAFRSHVEGSREGINPEVFRAGWYAGSAAQDLGLIDTITTN